MRISDISRRGFLGAAAAVGLSSFPRFLLRAAERAAGDGGGDGVLVVVQLSGGNDGLNTVIPYDDDVYHRSRPVLHIGKDAVLKLSPRDGVSGGAGPGVGFHPRMLGLHSLYGEGQVAVVQGVGYPNPSRSHFRSMDIWHSALPEIEDPRRGWLGQVCERRERGIAALHIGAEKLPLALSGDVAVPSLQNLDFLDALATAQGRKRIEQLRTIHRGERKGDLEVVRRLAFSTVDQLDKLIELRGKAVPVEYPNTSLSQRFKWAGQLISGGFPSRIYYLSQDGYDTHAQQKDGHANLLGELSDGIHSLMRHLEKEGQARRVAVLVFSEFGRRVRENASQGTDHGCAAPLLLVSGRARGGLHGTHPSLVDLDDGDVRFTVDFRRVYAALLEDVLGLDARDVLQGAFEKLPLVV